MPDLRDTIAIVRADALQRNTRCSAHDDRRASLSVGLGDDGRVLLHCQAGCVTEAVLEAAGLAWADLMPTNRNGHRQKSQIVATYPYHDEIGRHVYDVVRFSPKDFRQRRADGVWNMDGVRRVLFGLPELRRQKVTYVVEGEKDVLGLRRLGLPTTTSVGGAGKWRDEYTEQLRAAGVESVVILPDNDDPGRAHAQTVARSCSAAGFRVKVVTLPGLPPKEDVSDWLAAGHTRDELVTLVKGTALYLPALNGAAGRLQLTPLGDLLAESDEQVQFLVADRIASGSVNLLAGKPKAGQSTAARVLALEVARGGSWLGFRCVAGPVWYVALEDKRSELRRHFRQMGGTVNDPVRFIFPTDRLLDQVRTLASQEHPALIIVDTLQRLIGARDLNDYAEVTTKLTPILALARETDAAVLLVHHAGKSDRGGIDAVLGSTALTGSVDNVFILKRNDRYRTLESIQRIGPDLVETVLTLDETGHVDAGPTRHDAEVRTVADALTDALIGGSLCRQELLDAVDGRRQTKLEALGYAVTAGLIIRSGAGGKGNPYRYSLSEDYGSQVPVYSRELQKSMLKNVENANVFGSDCGSHDVPVSPGPREPQTPSREPQSTTRETFDL